MKPYWIHKTADGVFELRQWRFREAWILYHDEHPHDVCAVATKRDDITRTVNETLKAEDKTDWVIHLDPRSDDFVFTRRSHGDCWLHKVYPIWIVEYNEFPNQGQPRHWQVYVSRGDLNDREPWTSEDHSRLNHMPFAYRDPIDALHAAHEYAALFGRKAK